ITSSFWAVSSKQSSRLSAQSSINCSSENATLSRLRISHSPQPIVLSKRDACHTQPLPTILSRLEFLLLEDAFGIGLWQYDANSVAELCRHLSAAVDPVQSTDGHHVRGGLRSCFEPPLFCCSRRFQASPSSRRGQFWPWSKIPAVP